MFILLYLLIFLFSTYCIGSYHKCPQGGIVSICKSSIHNFNWMSNNKIKFQFSDDQLSLCFINEIQIRQIM